MSFIPVRLKSLRIRLLAVVALVALPLFWLYLHSAAQVREVVRQGAVGRVAHTAELIGREKQAFVLEVRDILAGLVDEPGLGPTARDRCNTALARIQDYQRHLSFVGIATPEGTLYCSSPATPEPIDVSDRPYFQAAVASCRPTLGRAQVGRVTGAQVIALAYPWCDSMGAVQRVAIGSMPLDWYGRILRESALPPGTRVSMVSLADRRVLLQYDGGLVPPDAAAYGTPVRSALLDAITARPGGRALKVEETDGHVTIGVPLEDGEQAAIADTALLFRIPSAEVYSGYDRLAREQLAILTLFTALVLTAAWFGSTATVVRPVRKMLHVIHRFAEGDGSARTGAPEGGAELAQLGHAFDRMADHVSSQQRDLVQVNRLYAVLSRVNSAIVRYQDREGLAGELTGALVDTGGFAAASVYWREGQGFQLFASACSNELAYTAAELWPVTTDATFDVVQVYNRHNPIAPAGSPWTGLQAVGSGAAAYIPIVPEQEVAAILVVAALADDAFGRKEIELLKEMSGDYAFALRMIEQQERFRFLSYNDPMTGLPNRYAFEQRLQQATGEAEDHQAVLALFKVDGYARINSLYGRLVADALLERVAAVLRKRRPPGTFLSRIGDADFAALYEGSADGAAEDTLREYIEGAFPGEVTLAGEAVFVSVSVGLARAPDDAATDTELLRCAHAALDAAASEETANSSSRFQPEMVASNSRRNRLEQALRRAVDNGELTLHFQPQVRLSDGRPCGMEALARWHHPDLGNVPPGEFIPLAEELGVIGPLGEWVLERALAQAAEWRAQGLDPGVVAVNLSPKQIHEGTTRHLAGLLEAHGYPADRLELELTETALTNEPGLMFERVRDLHALGVQTAIDDFGTGYSSLAYLKEFDFDKLKIDKSFVDHLTHHAHDAAIARAIIAMGKALGMTILAEGVEAEDQLYYLQRHGCDQIQGYLYSRPLPPDEAGAFLAGEHHLQLEGVDESRSTETLRLADNGEERGT